MAMYVIRAALPSKQMLIPQKTFQGWPRLSVIVMVLVRSADPH